MQDGDIAWGSRLDQIKPEEARSSLMDSKEDGEGAVLGGIKLGDPHQTHAGPEIPIGAEGKSQRNQQEIGTHNSGQMYVRHESVYAAHGIPPDRGKSEGPPVRMVAVYRKYKIPNLGGGSTKKEKIRGLSIIPGNQYLPYQRNLIPCFPEHTTRLGAIKSTWLRQSQSTTQHQAKPHTSIPMASQKDKAVMGGEENPDFG